MVVCTYKRSDALPACLKSLADQDWPGPYEVLVVDNSPEAEAEALCREHADRLDMHYLRSPEDRNLQVARNFGIEHARGDVVCFVDDDVVAPPGWLAGLMEVYESDEQAAGVGGPVLPMERYPEPTSDSGRRSVPTMTFYGYRRSTFDCTLDGAAATPMLQGCNMSFRRSVFDEAGLFDPNYTGSTYYEDNDFQYRVTRLGHKLVATPNAPVWHGTASEGGGREGAGGDTRLYLEYWTVRNSIYFVQKNLISPGIKSLLFVTHRLASLALRPVFTADIAGMAYARKAVGSVLRGHRDGRRAWRNRRSDAAWEPRHKRLAPPAPFARSRLRSLAFGAFVACLSGMLCVAAFEIGLRLGGVKLFEDKKLYMGDATSPLSYQNRPHFRGYYARVPVRTNSHGVRGPEYAVPKPPGTVRILCIGDSTTFGHGSVLADTYPYQLERMLRERYPPPARIEVINAGVNGYHTRLEYHWLKKLLPLYEPDLVLLQFLHNDLGNRDYFVVRNGTIQRIERPWYQPYDKLHQYLWRHSALYNFAWPRLQNLRYRFQTVPYLQPEKSLSELGQPGDWDNNKLYLRRIVAYCREHGVTPILFCFPELWILHNYRFEASHKEFDDFCRESGFDSVDVKSAFVGRTDYEKLWVSPFDRHPNREGHAITAQKIVDYLLEHGGFSHLPPRTDSP